MDPHPEKHFTAPEVVRDVVLGMADGLTVPFALAAGLSGAVASNALVVTAGLAEIAAGAVAMGLGGYLAAKGESQHYQRELGREWREVREKPAHEEREIEEIFEGYGLSSVEIAPIVAALKRQPDRWVDFMMRFELGLEKPNPRRAVWSAVTIGGAYVVGGLLPLSPYVLIGESQPALRASAVVTLAALAVFGWAKGRYTGVAPLRSACETLAVGSLAAAVAYAIAKSFSG